MACFRPLKAYRSAVRGPTGKRQIVFTPRGANVDQHLTIPCGQCIGCRIDRSKQWALRCVLEAKLYEANCFITLTYSDENLPANGSLSVRDWQLFMKRLKIAYSWLEPGKGKRKRRKYPQIRFYQAGEYGTQFGRPHYHACLFGFDFPDKKFKRYNRNGDKIYESDTLTRVWGNGMCEIGAVTPQSAAYVARYIMKKITGDDAVAYYDGRKPEFTTMSRRPGIGAGWLDKFQMDVFPKGYVVHDGRKHRVPRFFDSVYEIDHPNEMQRLKGARKRSAAKHAVDQTSRRLDVREKVLQLRVKRLKRELE